MKKFFIILGLGLLCFVIYKYAISRDLQMKAEDKLGISSVTEVESVPVIAQKPELPTGCEATAAAMLLQWTGVDVTKEDVANSLAKGPAPKLMNGKMYGANPSQVFVGDPFSVYGYGVFHEPIADVINIYLKNKTQDISGVSFNSLLKVIDSGRPVIVWATIDMVEPKVIKTWYDENGNKIAWKTPEHALLLIGYTKDRIIVNDPYTGSKKYYSKSTFQSSWEAMGRQAVTVDKLFAHQAKGSSIFSN